MKTHYLIIYLSLIFAFKSNWAQDSSAVTHKNHITLKLDIPRAFAKDISISLEVERGNKYAIEVGLGYFQYSSAPYANLTSGEYTGYFGRIGPKLYLKKVNKNNLHALQRTHSGYYVRTDLVAQFAQAYLPTYYTLVDPTNPTKIVSITGWEKQNFIGFGSVINFGLQLDLGSRVVVDGFIGIGLGYLLHEVTQSIEPYYQEPYSYEKANPIYLGVRGVTAIYQSGLKIGYKLN